MASRHNPRRNYSSHPIRSSFQENQITSHFFETTAMSSAPVTAMKKTESMNDSNVNMKDSEICSYGCCGAEKLSDFILRRGFFEGACSDITIKAFNKSYALHKLILDRSGYFSSLFNGPWNESLNTTLELVFDHDKNITKDAFEFAIAKLYGVGKSSNDERLNSSLIAVGQYLDIPEIVCNATDKVIDLLTFENISQISMFALENDYGQASERLIDSVKNLLCSDGWQAGVKNWDGIATSIIESVVGLDSFFVPSEWERTVFIIRLIERRQATNRYSNEKEIDEFNDVSKIQNALNSKVHFCHLTPERLHKLEDWKDINGENFIKPSVLRDALWLNITLQKKIAMADSKSVDLRLGKTTETPPNNTSSWLIPTKDETLYGTPDELASQLLDHHRIKEADDDDDDGDEDDSSGKTTENPNNENLYQVSEIPPFRFSVAFYGISEFDSDKRVYSKTLKYAGSYWNLYVQKMKHKKGYQMGVYLHRATSSSPSKNGLLNKDLFNRDSNGIKCDSSDFVQSLAGLSINPNGENGRGASVHSYSTAEEDTPESGLEEEEEEDDDEEDEEEEGETSFLEYEDNRDKSSVYYVIYTPSRRVKPLLTCFVSKPDLFNKSQSWGWKSNSMCSFKEDGSLSEGQDKILKFMVVLGNT